MRTIIILFLTISLFSTGLIAQRTYEEAIKMGDTAFGNEDFQKALDYYFAAEAFDESKKVAVQKKISVVLKKLNTIKDNAVKAKQAAEKEKQAAEKEKELAEEARNEAEKERQIAEEQTIRAEEQRKIAEKQTIRAKLSEKIAKEREKIAKEKEAEAVAAEKFVSRIKNIAAARVQANNSIRTLTEGKLEEGTQQALEAYELNKTSNGPKYNKDCYQALDAVYQADWKRKNKDKEKISPIYKVQDEAIRCISTIYHVNRKEIIAFAMDNQQLVIVENNKELQQIRLEGRPRSMAFSEDGEFLFVGTLSNELLIFQYDDKKLLYKEKIVTLANKGKGSIHSIYSFKKGNNSYLVFSDKEQVNIGVLEKGEKNNLDFSLSQIISAKAINIVTLSQDKEYLLLAHDKEIQLHRLEYNNNEVKSNLKQIVKNTYRQEVTAAAIGKNANNQYLLGLGFKNGRVNISSMDSLNCLFENTNCTYQLPLEHNINVTKILFNENATQMVTASLDHTAKLWNLENLDEDKIPLISHKKWIWDVIYNHNENRILTISEDKTIRVWFSDIDELSQISIFEK